LTTDWKGLRRDIPALQHMVHLNAGGFPPSLRSVTDEVLRLYRLLDEESLYSPPVWEQVLGGMEKVRGRVAHLLNAEPEEITLTENVSHGANIVANGLRWSEGDEVIYTDNEHVSGTLPWLNLARRWGVRPRVLEVSFDAQETLNRFEALLSPRTRLVYVSHVLCTNGLRLPVQRMVEMAHEHGALIMLDGAQAEGQLAVDVRALGCDFYAGCGHKWLLGPQGTGMLYLRRELLPELENGEIGWGSTKDVDRENHSFELLPSAARFEYGTRHWPLFLGLGKAVEYVEGIGVAEIEAHVQPLATWLKEELQRIPGAVVKSPLDPALSTGIVTFSLDGLDSQTIHRTLWEDWRVLLPHGASGWERQRVCVAFYVSEEDLGKLLGGLHALASLR
jgi:selenocysteine lyase/cysteine desulfurase